MAQKINPISLRLGVTQVWDSTIQNYGKLYTNYSEILHLQLKVRQFLIRFFDTHKILLGSKRFNHHNNKTLINIFYNTLDHNKDLTEIVFSKTTKPIFKWFSNLTLIRFYSKPQWFSTANLIFNYAQYLLKQSNSPNRILWSLCRFLELQLNSQKVLYSTHGPIQAKLKGFKICLSGRFDNSRNQMAKKIEQKVGSLSLMDLQSHVEFLNSEIHTKLGTCGLQIWLFYKIY